MAKYLVVRSNDFQEHHYPHPDPAKLGQMDLRVPSFGFVITDPMWQNVPSFAQAILGRTVSVEETDVVPLAQNFEVPEELSLRDAPILEHTAGQIAKTGWNERYAQIVSLSISSRDGTVTRDYLKGVFLKFLRNLLYQENMLQKRPEVIALVEERIQFINNL